MFREGTEERIEIKPETGHPCLPRWRRRVACAKERGFFDDLDRRAAFSWNTCAVGEATASYEVPLNNLAPKDPELIELGSIFYDAVRGDNFEEALGILTGIEDRLGELGARRRSR